MHNQMLMTTNESLLVAMDFSPQMAEDETIVSSNDNGSTSVTAVNSAGQPAAGFVESGSMNIDGQNLQARVEDGVSGEVYTVTFIAATSSGNIIEANLAVTCE